MHVIKILLVSLFFSRHYRQTIKHWISCIRILWNVCTHYHSYINFDVCIGLNLRMVWLIGFNSRRWGYHRKKIIKYTSNWSRRPYCAESCKHWEWRSSEAPIVFLDNISGMCYILKHLVSLVIGFWLLEASSYFVDSLLLSY